jgi:DNA polymerase-4
MSERSIIHLDMDAFYASVEVLDDPKLKDRPIIVGGLGVRSVVATASYEARRFGVHSAMPTARARQLCPHGVFLPPRMDRYAEISRQVMAIAERASPMIETLSLDEAFVDITASLRALGSAASIAKRLQESIRDELGLSASIGIAPNKLVAKLASEAAKPAGIKSVPPEAVSAFMSTVPLKAMLGVGSKTLKALEGIGIDSIEALATAQSERLVPILGSATKVMQQRARGLDDRPVCGDREDSSIGAESTFDVDLSDLAHLKRELMPLCERAAQRLRSAKRLAGQVQIKIKRPNFETLTRQISSRPPTDRTKQIYQLAEQLLERWWRESKNPAARLIGVSLSRLCVEENGFFQEESSDQRLDSARDALGRRFGKGALMLARGLKPPA